MLGHQLSGVCKRFKVLEYVGEGGNGTVKRCMEKQCGLMIAVTQVNFVDEKHKRVVFRETEFMKNLNHMSRPNTFNHHFVGFRFDEPHSSNVLIAMLLYQGSLWDLMPISDITVIEQVMMQIITGLLFMDQKRILHRDTKPDNILMARVSPTHAVLADFGWAASLDDELALKRPCGTVGFNAPEVAEEGESDTIQTTAIDIFSLGATFYFMIEPGLYSDQEFVANLANVSNRPPRYYAGLVLSMMAPNPNDRPSLSQCLDVVNKRLYSWSKESHLVGLSSFRQGKQLQAVTGNHSASSEVKEIASPPLNTPTAEDIAKPTMQPVKSRTSAKLPRSTHIRFADFDAPPPPYEMATNIFANLERQPRANEVAANRPARAAAHSKRWRNDRTARLERNRFGIPAPQTKEAKNHTKVANTEPTADQPLYQQQAPVPLRPSPRAQKANHKGIHSRHILGSTHESRYTSNGKFKYMKDDPPLRRQIRRDLAREGLILNHARTKKTATQLFRGLADLCRGAYDVAVGGVGLPWTLCSEAISLYRANQRLNTVCRGTAGLGCGPDGRLMYGLQPRVLEPLSISEYKAERLRSYQTWADSDEASHFSIRTRNLMAEHRAANPQEY
ncbi:hypothetical protein OEA41_009643 [Lepraria neglecta]|uniref:mitogen-activated protein kinase n=1 Tax=Lepraria neglecta TaxID=209136 RepID=A0AAD9Z3H1_9LECA|nr:hypothetical protein OEA41_009643 [Lepraria neglecta]